MSRSKIPQVISLLRTSGRDFFMDRAWAAITTVMVALVLGYWVWLKEATLPWIYVGLYFLAGIIFTFLLEVSVWGIFIAIRARKQKAQEQEKNARFFSPDKAFMDHRVSREKGYDTFFSTYSVIGKRLPKIKRTMSRLNLWLAIGRRILGPKDATLELRKWSEPQI